MDIGGPTTRRTGIVTGLCLMALVMVGCAQQPQRHGGMRQDGMPRATALVSAPPAAVGAPAYPGVSFGWSPARPSGAGKIGPPPLLPPDTGAAAPGTGVPGTASPRRPVAIVSDEDRRCFAANLYYEAGGEGEQGLIAVGHVVLNRLAQRPAGTTLCAVIYERMQFSWTRNLRRYEIVLGNSTRWQQAIAVTDRVLAGETRDPTGGATHFYSLISYRKHGPSWARSRVETVRIVNHAFLR